jgi:hypothetical protein
MQASAQRTLDITIDHFVMAVTAVGAGPRHAAAHRCRGAFRQTKGEMVMIDVLALAFVAVALSLPALIAATMLGSKLNLDW